MKIGIKQKDFIQNLVLYLKKIMKIMKKMIKMKKMKFMVFKKKNQKIFIFFNKLIIQKLKKIFQII